jgi:hypothetical protein
MASAAAGVATLRALAKSILKARDASDVGTAVFMGPDFLTMSDEVWLGDAHRVLAKSRWDLVQQAVRAGRIARRDPPGRG